MKSFSLKEGVSHKIYGLGIVTNQNPDFGGNIEINFDGTDTLTKVHPSELDNHPIDAYGRLIKSGQRIYYYANSSVRRGIVESIVEGKHPGYGAKIKRVRIRDEKSGHISNQAWPRRCLVEE